MKTALVPEKDQTGQMTICYLDPMKTRVVSATEFKAKCLALLDEIEQRGDQITITRRGRPVAVVGPPKRKPSKASRDRFAGRVQIVGDIVNIDMSDLWEVNRAE